ncbi:MAG: transglutaminase, partial [Mesorhizobium sp.]
MISSPMARTLRLCAVAGLAISGL